MLLLQRVSTLTDPPISLPSGIFSVLLVTVGGDGVHVSVHGEAEMKGPLQIMETPNASFSRGGSESQRGRKKTYLPKVAEQVKVNTIESA